VVSGIGWVLSLLVELAEYLLPARPFRRAGCHGLKRGVELAEHVAEGGFEALLDVGEAQRREADVKETGAAKRG